jgi:hypothetical protein
MQQIGAITWFRQGLEIHLPYLHPRVLRSKECDILRFPNESGKVRLPQVMDTKNKSIQEQLMLSGKNQDQSCCIAGREQPCQTAQKI